MRKKIILFLSTVLLISNININYADAGTHGFIENNQTISNPISNPISQQIVAYYCEPLSKNLIYMPMLSRYIYINGEIDNNVLNNDYTYSSRIPSDYYFKNFFNNLQFKDYMEGKEIPYTISINTNTGGFNASTAPSYGMKPNPFIKYELLVGNSGFKINNKLYAYWNWNSNAFSHGVLEKRITVKNMDDLKKLYGNNFNNLNLIYGTEYTENRHIGYVDISGENNYNNYSGKLKNYRPYLVVSSDSDPSKTSGYSVSNLNRDNFINNFNLDLNNINNFEKIISNFTNYNTIYDIKDTSRIESKNYHNSLEFGAYSKSVTDKGINALYKFQDETSYVIGKETDYNIKSKCNAGEVVLDLVTLRGYFGDLLSYGYIPKIREVGPDKVKPIKIDAGKITDSGVTGDTDSVSESELDSLNENLQVTTELNINLPNIPEKGNIVSGDSYFTPQVTISNGGKSSNLLLDTNTNNSEQYKLTQWSQYNETNTNTDIVLLKLDNKDSSFEESNIKFDADNSLTGLTQLTRLSSINKNSDFTKLSIKEAGDYVIAVRSTDKTDSTKSKSVYRHFKLSFNDNIGALPVRNNLLFNINDKNIMFNKRQISLGISRPTLTGYNSLKIPSVTNSNGETLIANENGEFVLLDKELKKVTNGTLPSSGKVNSVETVNGNSLIGSSLGLMLLKSDSLELVNLEGDLNGNINDVRMFGDYIIVTNNNEISIIGIDFDNNKATKGITYTDSVELNNIEDLGKFITLTDSNGKIKVISKN